MSRHALARGATGLAALSLLAALWPAPAAAQGIFDRLKQAAGVVRAMLPISTAKEVEIGRGIAATIAGRYPISHDTALTRYVNLVGLTVAGVSPRPDINYHFAVLETPEVNAFAAPGGYVFITRGALGLIHNEAELAGVLGHEVGHVNARHVINEIRKSDAMSQIKSDLDIQGGALDKLVGTGSDALFMGLSRGDELQADSLGLEYAAAAGYDPGALAAFVGRLKQHASESGLRAFFATHPKPDERVARLNAIQAREHLTGGVDLAQRYQEEISR